MLPKEHQDQIDRAAAMVEEALQHHREAMDAWDDGDDRGVKTAHAGVTRCLRSAGLAFMKLGELAAQADLDANKQVQTSGGTGESGGSANGRGSPLQHGDFTGWLDRARVGAGRR